MMLALARRHGVALPYADVEAVREAYAFTSLQSFLDLYYAGEEGPPDYIRQALDLLQVQRIDHGVQAVHDAALQRAFADAAAQT